MSSLLVLLLLAADLRIRGLGEKTIAECCRVIPPFLEKYASAGRTHPCRPRNHHQPITGHTISLRTAPGPRPMTATA